MGARKIKHRKFNRRIHGYTDYRQRARLLSRPMNDIQKKYRLIVRLTNKDVIAQIAYDTPEGDHIISAAYAHELYQYGVKAGFTNYASCYATGLLIARRTLKQLNLDEAFTGQTEVDGKHYLVEPVGDKRPFKCILDKGLVRNTLGARVFAVMKGAVDGGLEIPHSDRKFAGYDPDTRILDPDDLRDRLFGNHVADYMRLLEDEDPEKYQEYYGGYIKAGISADDIEGIYFAAHEAIRADPFLKQEKKKESISSTQIHI